MGLDINGHRLNSYSGCDQIAADARQHASGRGVAVLAYIARTSEGEITQRDVDAAMDALRKVASSRKASAEQVALARLTISRLNNARGSGRVILS
ncbi:hypothetical protein [Embleya sp. NPDC005575]|uniref:hypothetical protein n=1 Tax=Embleya sp. NPDC005575 TaxID=3156892 RepID=UPI0033ADED87